MTHRLEEHPTFAVREQTARWGNTDEHQVRHRPGLGQRIIEVTAQWDTVRSTVENLPAS